jgi:hypothetical protein
MARNNNTSSLGAPPSGSDHDSIDKTSQTTLLMEEYKLHKQEAIQHFGVLYRQSSFIQLFGLVLISLTALVHGNTQAIYFLKAPLSLRFFSLAGVAILLFYLASTVATASYSLLIGRRRMAELETQINALAAQELLSYETDLSRRSGRDFSLLDGALTPLAWAFTWRLALFFGAILCLAFLSFEVMPDGYAAAYTAGIVYFSVQQLKHYYITFAAFGTKSLDRHVRPQPVRLARLVGRIAHHLTNAIVLILFFIIFLGDTATIAHSVDHAVAGLGGYATWQIALAILVYSFICTVGFPAPSEATLLLIPQVGPVVVYASSSIGRGLGSVALAAIVYYWLNQRGRGFDRFRSRRIRLQLSRIGLKLNRWLTPVYFLCQAIPWGPAKSSTIFYSGYIGLSKTVLAAIFFLSGIGMIIRMFLVSLLL